MRLLRPLTASMLASADPIGAPNTRICPLRHLAGDGAEPPAGAGSLRTPLVASAPTPVPDRHRSGVDPDGPMENAAAFPTGPWTALRAAHRLHTTTAMSPLSKHGSCRIVPTFNLGGDPHRQQIVASLRQAFEIPRNDRSLSPETTVRLQRNTQTRGPFDEPSRSAAR